MEDLSNDNIIHIKKDNLEYIQFRRLLEYEDILKHGIFFKPLNFNEKNLSKECLDKNYKVVCKELGIISENMVNKKQTHSANVACIELEHKNYFYDNTDGFITNQKDIILPIVTADCISMMLFEPKKRVIANIHSGWRGTSKRIIETTVNKMIKNYGIDVSECICCITPSIGKCHFEVSEDVKKIFENEFKDILYKNIILNSNKGTYFIDTVLINKLMLLNLGLKEDNIIQSNICTVCNIDKFHSYRKEKELSGRNLNLITLI